MPEVWKPVVGYEASHEVSSLGRVRAKKREFCGGKTRKDGTKSIMTVRQKVLKEWLSPRGYLVCSLSFDRACKFRVIHRIVAEAFIGPAPSDRHEVNHKDGNKLNNCADNLEWMTPSENSQHAYDSGLKVPVVGTRINTAKLDEDKVREIRALAAQGMSQRKIGARFGITPGPVQAIISRRTWKHVE